MLYGEQETMMLHNEKNGGELRRNDISGADRSNQRMYLSMAEELGMKGMQGARTENRCPIGNQGFQFENLMIHYNRPAAIQMCAFPIQREPGEEEAPAPDEQIVKRLAEKSPRFPVSICIAGAVLLVVSLIVFLWKSGLMGWENVKDLFRRKPDEAKRELEDITPQSAADELGAGSGVNQDLSSREASDIGEGPGKTGEEESKAEENREEENKAEESKAEKTDDAVMAVDDAVLNTDEKEADQSQESAQEWIIITAEEEAIPWKTTKKKKAASPTQEEIVKEEFKKDWRIDLQFENTGEDTMDYHYRKHKKDDQGVREYLMKAHAAREAINALVLPEENKEKLKNNNYTYYAGYDIIRTTHTGAGMQGDVLKYTNKATREFCMTIGGRIYSYG